MADFIGPPLNFTISDTAKAKIAELKADPRLQLPEDPAEVLAIAWGEFFDNDRNRTREGVTLSFFLRSQTRNFQGEYRMISGIPAILNATPDYAANFDGKILDYSDSGWFFLRD